MTIIYLPYNKISFGHFFVGYFSEKKLKMTIIWNFSFFFNIHIYIFGISVRNKIIHE